MDGPFDSAHTLIEEAEENIRAFDAVAAEFIHRDNWSGIQEIDPQTAEDIIKIQFKAAMPPKMSLRARDVFRNLRDALDHILFASALTINGKKPKRYKFPFGDTASAFEHRIVDGYCDDLHPDIIKIIIASAPYEAGNRPLWAMNKVRNKDTHEILSPAVINSQGFGIGNGTFSGTFKTVSEWRATRRQLTFLRARLSPDTNVEIHPDIRVSLNPAFGFGKKTASEVLSEAHKSVASIVSHIERETIRLSA